jgi:hypothetical protein
LEGGKGFVVVDEHGMVEEKHGILQDSRVDYDILDTPLSAILRVASLLVDEIVYVWIDGLGQSLPVCPDFHSALAVAGVHQIAKT